MKKIAVLCFAISTLVAIGCKRSGNDSKPSGIDRLTGSGPTAQADFPLLIQFKKGFNPSNVSYAVEGFASVNGTAVPGEFIVTSAGQTQTATVDSSGFHVGDVVTVTGGFAPAKDDVKNNGKPRKHDKDGKNEGSEGATIQCPTQQIHVIPGGTNGFLECGPVEFSYNPDSNSCVTVCN